MSPARAVRETAVLLLILALTACATTAVRPRAERTDGAAPPHPVRRPNIVFVLTDDLTSDLLAYMPNVQRLRRDGRAFTNYFVTDSFCCPSRASIFTGQFPHDTHVYVNSGKNGGFGGFTRNGKDKQTFATALRAAGYRTAMFGKYLNNYGKKTKYVPPGWDEWHVTDDGYSGFGYTLNDNGKLTKHGNKRADYYTDMLSGQANRFLNRSAGSGRPFMMEVATFAPHVPATPAPRDAKRFPKVRAPRGPAYDPRDMTEKPCWLRNYRTLTGEQSAEIDKEYVRRVQSVQAVDRMVGRLRDTLRKRGLAGNTYLVFSSDNGYHMGQYRLMPGKTTAYDTDIKVPLMVTGPGVAAGSRTTSLAENVDLAPTFEDLAGVRVPSTVDGRSLVPALLGRPDTGAPGAVLIEHHGPNPKGFDPDRTGAAAGNPPTYSAIRTPTELYVRYRTGDIEYHDLREDPHELSNTIAELTPAHRARLAATLKALTACHGRAACAAAGAR